MAASSISEPAAFVVAGMGLAVLWTQFPPLHPFLLLFTLIIFLGMYLRESKEINSQFSTILKWNGRKGNV